ncbi:hypothetical protein JTB14_021700 [Gonioctena quinquepunctata]|nr:hypothetical protein JTB14_021700 [Gonioctena quinquepunctata]
MNLTKILAKKILEMRDSKMKKTSSGNVDASSILGSEELHVCVSMQVLYQISWYVFLAIITIEVTADDDDYNILHGDGSYDFGYNNPDSYHYAAANRNNVVKGEFGGRSPKTGAIDSTIYTAGPRGFRPRGKNVVRKYNLNQAGPRPIGSRDDPYYDPYEDPSYDFSFKTRTYSRVEKANRVGDVNGKYSYVDDVGERHNVEFIAGKNTGFHVKTPFPDSNPRAYGPLYFRGRGKPIPRGRTSIQRGLDGSYKFVSAGPDQRRTETSDSTGHVRGSYTYLDDKGVQHSVHYIAGPETGYRVLKQVKGPHLPTVFPFDHPNVIPPDFYDYDRDVFDTAASGHVKPSGKPGKKDEENGVDEDEDDFGFGSKKPTGALSKPGGAFKPGITSAEDDGSYKPSGEDGAYIPPAPSYGSSTTRRPGGKTTSRPSTVSPGESYDQPSSTAIPTGDSSESGYGGSKPPPGFGGGYPTNGIDSSYGLFGSESNHPRPPPYGGPAISVTGENCPRCTGTIVTNLGDSVFSVPPGVSIRAHVQAIDLLPFGPNVPSPSEQYKADLVLRTEQLNANEDGIVDSNETDITTEESTTQIVSTTNTATT